MAPTPSFERLWPTLFMSLDLPGHAQANPVLEALLLSEDAAREDMTGDYLAGDLLDRPHPALGWLRQITPTASRGGRFFRPAGPVFVDWLDLLVEGGIWHVLDAGAVGQPVAGADLQFRQPIQDIQFGYGQLGEAIQVGHVAQIDRIQPTTAARPAGGGPILVPFIA